MEGEEKDPKTTPEPPTEPPVHTDPPASPPEPSTDDLRATVHGLVEKVAGIEGMIAGLASGQHGGKDETPVKAPWTHRKFS